MNRYSALVIVLLVFLCLPASAGDTPPISLTVLHVNDFHGRTMPYLDKGLSETVPVGGAPRLARLIEEERSGNPDGTLLLAAGDMFQGTALSNIFFGRPVIEFMNTVHFDAMVLGNHEFDWGLPVLKELAGAAGFPFIAANIADKRGRPLPGVKPYLLLVRKGLKVAVIGVTTPETSVTTKPDHVSGLVFSSPKTALPPVIKKARSQGAQLVILLSHLGADADRNLARQVTGIDLIVGGHSHTVLSNPEVVSGTVIVQAGAYGAYLGVLHLQVDPRTGRIVDYTKANELRTVWAGPGEPVHDGISAIVSRYHDQIKGELSKVVGVTSVDLVRYPYQESNVGNLICDAMREASGADLALFNGGGIRADILKGPVNLEQIYALLPFDNVLVTMDLTGRQIRELLEQSAMMTYRILQVSGIQVRYDTSRPVGSRVLEALVAGAPLMLEKTYRVATNDFLAQGGDQFEAFKAGRNIAYGDTVRDVLSAYLRRHSPVQPQIEGRIVFDPK